MNLTDAFTGSIALFTVTFIEVLVVVYVYEVHRFADDCYQMTGKRLAHIFRWVYQYVQPFLQSMFLIFALMNFAFAQVGQFVENQPAPPQGAGCGDDDCNSAMTHGICDQTNAVSYSWTADAVVRLCPWIRRIVL
ncbi:MAG: hypothetical protein KVP17_000368 [Porospora cf. gigantea B]|uniref:uncharacterized protein n=1 Tax=Porospora cf. gigantea B TaxID=2853592 RepID=UPI003571D2F2|nr:MAG: hypothetical protein KVP17_000368 [Porospora cf. gigantea B]